MNWTHTVIGAISEPSNDIQASSDKQQIKLAINEFSAGALPVSSFTRAAFVSFNSVGSDVYKIFSYDVGMLFICAARNITGI